MILKKINLFKNKLYILILLIIVGIVIYFLNNQKDYKFFEVLIGFNFDFFWVILPTYFFALIAAALNWQLIISRFIESLDWKEHVKIFLVTLATRRIPGTLWYVGGRIALYKEKNCSPTLTTIASGIEYVFGALANLFLGLVLLPFGFDITRQDYIYLFLIFILLFIVFIHPKTIKIILKWIKKPIDHEITFKQNLIWFSSSLILKILSGLMVGIVSLGYWDFTVTSFLLIIGVWSISTAITSLTFFLPSNFGITEITFSGFLATIMPLSVSVSIALMIRFLTTLLEIAVSGIIFLFYLFRRNR